VTANLAEQQEIRLRPELATGIGQGLRSLAGVEGAEMRLAEAGCGNGGRSAKVNEHKEARSFGASGHKYLQEKDWDFWVSLAEARRTTLHDKYSTWTITCK
jgi:hypothetical protein